SCTGRGNLALRTSRSSAELLRPVIARTSGRRISRFWWFMGHLVVRVPAAYKPVFALSRLLRFADFRQQFLYVDYLNGLRLIAIPTRREPPENAILSNGSF